MNQRRLVWQALRDGGILESDEPRLQELVAFLREHSDMCWSDFIPEFRARFYDTFDRVVEALEGSNDPLIRSMLIMFADPQRPKERQMLTHLAHETDFQRDTLAAERLTSLHVPEVDQELRRRGVPGTG